MPAGFTQLFLHVHGLAFDETPDYDFLQALPWARDALTLTLTLTPTLTRLRLGAGLTLTLTLTLTPDP